MCDYVYVSVLVFDYAYVLDLHKAFGLRVDIQVGSTWGYLVEEETGPKGLQAECSSTGVKNSMAFLAVYTFRSTGSTSRHTRKEALLYCTGWCDTNFIKHVQLDAIFIFSDCT